MQHSFFHRLAFASLMLALPLWGVSGGALKQSQPDELSLTILHTNDTHANWGGHTKDGRICYAPQCDGGTGGSLRLDRAVRAVRAERPATLLLGAGDQFQGTLYFTRFKDAMAADVVNALGYDAFVPGNHEFDDGCPRFKSFVRALKTPVVAANLTLNDGSGLPLAPWIITERQGQRIGVIGLANPDTPNLSSPCKEAVFAPVEPALRKSVEELRAQGVRIVIVLTHLGLADDRALARAVAGVDVIVGGHTHSLLSNTDKKAVGPYPVVETSPANEPVLVVTAGYAGKALGRLDVRFDAAGVVQSWNGGPIPLTDAALKDMNAPAANAKLAKMMNTRSIAVRSMLEEPLGRINADVPDGDPLEGASVLLCRAGECRSGNIVADALLEYWKGGADIALAGGGSLRNSLPAGKVTAGDVIASLPFENTVMLTEMDGKTLLAALEQGLSRYEEGKGFFQQVAGLHYAFNPKNARGRRLLSAKVPDGKGGWKPVAHAARYKVSAMSFQARGGDGYSIFVPLRWKDSEQNMSDVVRAYISAHSPLHSRLEGRITKK